MWMPCRMVLGQDSFLGLVTVIVLYLHTDFVCFFFHESALTNPLACISLKVLTTQ